MSQSNLVSDVVKPIQPSHINSFKLPHLHLNQQMELGQKAWKIQKSIKGSVAGSSWLVNGGDNR
jgi:hypothetical protein